MPRNTFTLLCLAAILTCATARGLDIVDSPQTISLVNVGDNSDNANDNITITDDGSTAGTLTVSKGTASTGKVIWNVNSIAITGQTLGGASLVLNGGIASEDAVRINIKRSLSIGHDSLQSTMRVTGAYGELYAAEGVAITGVGVLHVDASSGKAELNAKASNFSILSNNTTSSAINLQGASATNSATLGVKSISLLSGRVQLGGTFTTFTAESASSVGGYQASEGAPAAEALLVAGGAGTTNFKSTLTVGEGGVVTNSAAGTLTIGGTSGLILAGGSLVAGTGGLTLNSDRITVSGTATSIIDTTDGLTLRKNDGTATTFADGTALVVRGNLAVGGANALDAFTYTQTSGEVVTANGGTIHVLATGEAAGISGGTFAATAQFDGGVNFTGQAELKGVGQTLTIGAGYEFTTGASTQINLREGGLTLQHVGSGDTGHIAGATVFGGTAAGAHTLVSNGNLQFAEGARLSLDGDFSRVVVAGATATALNTLAHADGTLSHSFTDEQLVADNFLLGVFTIKADGQNLFVAAAERHGLLLDGTAGDYAQAADLIGDRYGAGVNDGLALNIYKSVVNATSVPGNYPPYDALERAVTAAEGSGSRDEASYTMNLANFKAFARGDDVALDGSLAALYNGVNNSGVIEVAISTANSLVAHNRSHLRKIAAVRSAVRDCVGSDSALAATIINSEKANRFWVGGFGIWEDADENNGLPGYRYDAGGFIGGYDHAFGPFSVGGSFAYAKGDFYDKSALSHDSDISSYSMSLNGAYFHPDGLYATLITGYTYSDNTLRELRSNAVSSTGTSWNTAEYRTDTWTAAAEIGHEFRPSACLAITPSLGFTYIYARNDNHVEYLGGVRAGKVRGAENEAAYIPLRLEVGYDIPMGAEAKWNISANGGYAYNFCKGGIDGTFDPYGFANAASHFMQGRDPGRHSYNAGVAARFTSDCFDLGVDYAYFHRASYNAHRVMATAGLRF